jgi:thiamine kinase-like enzyme
MNFLLSFGVAIKGFHFNEDNADGRIVRDNYNEIFRTLAQLHVINWENGEAFGKVGLPGHFDNKENMLAWIQNAMEKPFKEYRNNEESGKIPKADIGENNITAAQLDYFEEALKTLKEEYPKLIESRFHTGKNITIIHGDLHPGNIFLKQSPYHPDNVRTIEFDEFQNVRIGLCTEDLAMLLALHFEPDKMKAEPLLQHYHTCLCETAKDYPYETFMNDYKLSIMENMFFTIRLLNHGIYDFRMRDRAIKAYETFVLEK